MIILSLTNGTNGIMNGGSWSHLQWKLSMNGIDGNIKVFLLLVLYILQMKAIPVFWWISDRPSCGDKKPRFVHIQKNVPWLQRSIVSMSICFVHVFSMFFGDETLDNRLKRQRLRPYSCPTTGSDLMAGHGPSTSTRSSASRAAVKGSRRAMMPGWDDFLGDLGDGDGDEDIQHGFHDVPCYTVKSIMSTIWWHEW